MSFKDQFEYSKNYNTQEAMAYREAIERMQFDKDILDIRLLDTKNNYQAFLRGKSAKFVEPLLFLDIKSNEIKEQVKIDKAFLELKQKLAKSSFWQKILQIITKF